MSAGLDSSIQTLNRQCGQAVVALANALDAVVGLNAMLQNAERGFAVTGSGDSQVDPLITGDAAMSSDDAATLRNGMFALAQLAQVAYGQTAQEGASPTNFFFDGQKLMGANPL